MSCTLTSNFGPTTCTDTTGLTANQVSALRVSCTNEGDASTPIGDSGVVLSISGTFANAACSQVGVVGGCEVDDMGDFTTTIWTYVRRGTRAADTVASVQMQCAQLYHGSYVSPSG